ncbi:MAG: hypothetical protein GY809_19035 [Planctomycetes bacterium]|nr:hypothetical protein [Planctomycetota bacterium]
MIECTERRVKRGRLLFWGVCLCMVIAGPVGAAQDELEAMRSEMAQLKALVESLSQQVETLSPEDNAELDDVQAQLEEIREDVDTLSESSSEGGAGIPDGLRIGGYGDVHANFSNDGDSDKVDFHRLVLYLGYDFSDWIKFHSETELEHSWTDDGYVLLEQAYADFLLSDAANIRAGRVLAPVGIVNQNHEPTLFNGVERPNFSKYIIPTTWSLDGVGVFGNINPVLSYQAYMVAGMDGNSFTSSGIRGGRMKSRQSLNEVAVTGRLDFRPFEQALANADQSLRFGVSGWFGGLDNTTGGGGNGKGGEMAMTSGDFEYSVGRFDFRGVVAHTHIDGASNFGPTVAEEMFGWYLESAYHIWPDVWKTGKLAKSDATVFVRYEEYDTQDKMPTGSTRDPAKDIEEVTFGVNFYPVPSFVVKADYQIRENASGSDMDDLFNLGFGFAF